MKFKGNISILILFILALLVGYHSSLPSAAQAFSIEVEDSFFSTETDAEIDLVGPLKIAPASVTIIGPTSGIVNTNYFFSAQVSPDNVTQPYTHHWQADGQAPVTQEGGGIDAVLYSWDQPGTYIITLDTSNNDGSANAVHEITITEPLFPLIRVDIGRNRGTPRFLDDGTVIITFPRLFVEDVSLWVNVPFCADGTAPTAVFLDMITDNTTSTLPMSNLDASANTYIASIARYEIPIDNSTLNVRAVCPSGDESIKVGAIRLYDPIGRVTDASTGQPIGAAEVTLYHVPDWSPRTSPSDNRPNTCESNLSKDASAAWSQPAPIGQGVVVDPVNTHIAPPTSSRSTANDGINDGVYGWDLPQGCWYVRVTALGYQPLTSAVVGVPSAVTDLDLVLRPLVIVPSTPNISGQVILERRGDNNHSGATVCIGNECTTTSDDGTYTLFNVPATDTVMISHPGYLSGSYDYSRLDPGPFTTPVVELLGGDINASGTIDIDDAVLMGLAWNSRPGNAHWNAAADITDDGIVDQRDMDAVQFNWGKTAE